MYDHTDLEWALFSSLKLIARLIVESNPEDETIRSEALETIDLLENHENDIPWMTDRLTQAKIDLEHLRSVKGVANPKHQTIGE